LESKEEYTFDDSLNSWGMYHLLHFMEIKGHFRGKTNLSFLEIGIYEAQSTVWLLDNVLLDPRSQIWCIDPYPHKNARYNLSLHKNSKACLWENTSEEVLPEMLSSQEFFFDFIYVNGDYNGSTVIFDLVLAWRLLKVGGLILISDYQLKEQENNANPSFAHPKLAIDTFMYLYQGDFTIFYDNSLTCLKKLA